jgi:hypothetical protein
MKLQFKFTGAAGPNARQQLLKTLAKTGAAAVRPLFPDESDPELASLHVVDCDAAAAEKLLALLKASGDVEFAEVEARRGMRGSR